SPGGQYRPLAVTTTSGSESELMNSLNLGQSLGDTLSAGSPGLRQQCAEAVLMIRSAAFDYNPETALTNKMQHSDGVQDSRSQARAEFAGLVRALQSEGISVCAVED